MKHRFIVRDCYKRLWEIIKDDIETEEEALVLGTPGTGIILINVGKSHFLLYVAYMLWRDGKEIMYRHADSDSYVHIKGGEAYEYHQLNVALKQNKDIWWLYDTVRPTLADGMKILVSSPRSKIYNDFQKRLCPFYMPLWSLEELLTCKQFLNIGIEDEKIRYNFLYLNGVARHVFTVKKKSAKEMIDEAIKKSNINDLMRIVESTDLNPHVSHLIVLIDPNPDISVINGAELKPFQRYTTTYSSDYAALKVLTKYEEDQSKNVIQFIHQTNDMGFFGATRGKVFELVSHLILSAGGEFYCRELFKSTDVSKEEWKTKSNALNDDIFQKRKLSKNVSDSFFKLVLRKRNITRVKTVDEIGDYCQPISEIFTGIDSWIKGLAMFQMTVSKSHDIHSDVVGFTSKLDTNKFIFACYDEYKYDYFKRKNLDGLDQYVMLINGDSMEYSKCRDDYLNKFNED